MNCRMIIAAVLTIVFQVHGTAYAEQTSDHSQVQLQMIGNCPETLFSSVELEDLLRAELAVHDTDLVLASPDATRTIRSGPVVDLDLSNCEGSQVVSVSLTIANGWRIASRDVDLNEFSSDTSARSLALSIAELLSTLLFSNVAVVIENFDNTPRLLIEDPSPRFLINDPSPEHLIEDPEPEFLVDDLLPIPTLPERVRHELRLKLR